MFTAYIIIFLCGVSLGVTIGACYLCRFGFMPNMPDKPDKLIDKPSTRPPMPTAMLNASLLDMINRDRARFVRTQQAGDSVAHGMANSMDLTQAQQMLAQELKVPELKCKLDE
jgi:hypothetical protein